LVSVGPMPMRHGQLFLVVEQQAVFAPAGEQVQFDAQFGEEASARSNWRTSDAVISPARASDFQSSPMPAARATHWIACRSRPPPGLSLQLGSRL
jgi:hypothetical protein